MKGAYHKFKRTSSQNPQYSYKITEGFTYSIVKKKKEEEEEDRSLMTLHQREHKGNKNIVHVCKVAMILFYYFNFYI